jgi:phage terminase small subunit
MPVTKLNPRRERFCHEYLIDLNQTQAAIRAGYSPKTASEQAYDFLKNLQIQARISELKKEREDRTEITADRVLQQYCDIADYRIEDVMDFDGEECIFKPMKEWPRSARAAISSVKQTSETRRIGKEEIKTVKIEFKVDDRLRALDAMAKHLGLFDNFHTARATFRSYGIELVQDEAGAWKVETGDD